MPFVANHAEVAAILVALALSKISHASPQDVWPYVNTCFLKLVGSMKSWPLRLTMSTFASGFDKRGGALFGRQLLSFITKNRSLWEGMTLAEESTNILRT
jgi:hypothetical protein